MLLGIGIGFFVGWLFFKRPELIEKWYQKVISYFS